MIDDFSGALRAEREGRRRVDWQAWRWSVFAGLLALAVILLAFELVERHTIPTFNEELQP